MKKKDYVVWFNQVDKDDGELVGGKGANLGEMVSVGIPIPPGFIVTSNAYYRFIEKNKLKTKIKDILKASDINDPRQLNSGAIKIQKLILKGDVPKEVAKEVMCYYLALSAVDEKTYRISEKLSDRLLAPFREIYVAVRSSATAEDLPDASFAGQQETFLNILGESNVVNTVRKCWASLFTPRAIFYREENKFDHFDIGIAVPVQKMIQSDTSGVMFTIDPTTNEKDKIVIEAVFGLGEMIVQGQVTPDHYLVRKSDLKLLAKEVKHQEKEMVKKKKKTVVEKLSKQRGGSQKVSDKNIVEIARLGKKIEKHYYFPQDIEWGIENKKVYILQSRPVTTMRKGEEKVEDFSKLVKDKKVILEGVGASIGVASGQVKIVKGPRHIGKVKKGDILVAKMTNPDYVPVMKIVSGIITDEGGRTCHAAIVSRELGIPCIVGSRLATKKLKENQIVTLDGEKGKVYEGGLSIKPINIKTNIVRENGKRLVTATKLYVNISTPELASEMSARDVDGVGLLRAEFMIANIGIHPRKLIKDGKSKMFIDELAKGIKTICEAFSPRPVVYRATDFKTNEYRNLVGGKEFEQEEPNPMIGFRGAYRYVKDAEVFKLEIEAIKRVRNKHGLKNLWMMIPFVRTVNELKEVKKILGSNNLFRTPTFKLWMMAEVPSNFLLIDEFIKVGIDGISIGSNDLTMLILGVDRDNAEVASEYDERNEAVYMGLEKIVKGCIRNHVSCSICGQAPSDFPDYTQKLVDWGATSISVNPDAIDRTRELIYDAEHKKVKRKR